MKTLRYIFILLCLSLGACTQSDGHLGPLFGSWVLNEASADGQAMNLPEDSETFWSFQNSVIRVIYTAPGTATTSYGSFANNGNTLELDFDNHDNNTPAGSSVYKAPTWMGFPERGVFVLSIERLDSKNMKLSWLSAEGVEYKYTFSKTW